MSSQFRFVFTSTSICYHELSPWPDTGEEVGLKSDKHEIISRWASSWADEVLRVRPRRVVLHKCKYECRVLTNLLTPPVPRQKPLSYLRLVSLQSIILPIHCPIGNKTLNWPRSVCPSSSVYNCARNLAVAVICSYFIKSIDPYLIKSIDPFGVFIISHSVQSRSWFLLWLILTSWKLQSVDGVVP